MTKIALADMQNSLMASGVNPKWIVLGCIKNGQPYPTSMEQGAIDIALADLLAGGQIAITADGPAAL